MAQNIKNTTEKTGSEWILERKQVAVRQLARMPELTKALFQEASLDGFLTLLSRHPHYSYRNLLIIYERYPGATVLAGFSAWQQLLEAQGSTEKVLTAAGRGNGIDLVAPFTNIVGDREFELTWFSPLVFDIKQTNVKNFKSRPPVYIMDSRHQLFLSEAVTAALGALYGHRVIYEAPSQKLQASGALGRICKYTVSVLRNAKEEDALFWLTEALCELSIGQTDLHLQTQGLLQQCIHICLYKMWGLAHPGVLPGSHSVVSETEQPLFLDLLQRTVFLLHQQIAGFYLSQRKEEDLLQEVLETNFTLI